MCLEARPQAEGMTVFAVVFRTNQLVVLPGYQHYFTDHEEAAAACASVGVHPSDVMILPVVFTDDLKGDTHDVDR